MYVGIGRYDYLEWMASNQYRLFSGGCPRERVLKSRCGTYTSEIATGDAIPQ